MLKTVFEFINFDNPLVLLHYFVSPLSHQQNISLWGLFSSGEMKKKCCSGRDQVNREGGAQGSFLVKNWWTPRCGQMQKHWKSLEKNSPNPNTASHNTDTDGFLEHSPNMGNLYDKEPFLQKIIPALGGSPSYLEDTAQQMPTFSTVRQPSLEEKKTLMV